MNREEFDRFRDEHYDTLCGINRAKGKDYAGDEDALANFKQDRDRIQKIAERSPHLLKWYVYFDKHLQALFSFLENGDVASEPIEGRIHDLIVYEFLLLGLIEDHTRQAAAPADEVS